MSSRAIPPMRERTARDGPADAEPTPATMNPAELRREMKVEGRKWRYCLGRLKAAHAWFAAHDRFDPDWPAATVHAYELTTAAFRARLAGGNALLSYVARCTAMSLAERHFEADILGLDPTDAATIWLVYFPCPHAASQLSYEMLGPSPWWETSLGELPQCLGECKLACVSLIPAGGPDGDHVDVDVDERETPS